jgi:CubicO group peptidase (beta-lactamase class C family)
VPFNAMPGFGHAGLGGSLGWADPASGLAFGFVHNRLLSPFVVLDHAGFVATGAMIRRGAAGAREHGFHRVSEFGSPFPEAAATG